MENNEEAFQRQLALHKENLSSYWSDEQWLLCNFLDNESVMTYFYCSIFYEKSANNEKTKEDLKKMKYMRGLEYILTYSLPDKGIFHIKKQYRTNEKKVTPISIYYVYHGRIYESPSLSRVISSKVRNLSFSLNDSLNQLTSYLETQNTPPSITK